MLFIAADDLTLMTPCASMLVTALDLMFKVPAVTSIVVVLVTTMLVTVLVVPDRAAPVEGQFRSARELLSKTFAVPFRNRDFLWLMVSRLLIFMGFGGLQNFAFFYFDNVFFQHDRKATTIAASTLLGLSIGVAAFAAVRTGVTIEIFGSGCPASPRE